MKQLIDNLHINCDMGEGFGPYHLIDDALLMPHISAANIACGFHAGDPTIMKNTINTALKHGVEIGAHPGYPDKEGFGRRNMDMEPGRLHDMILYQVGAIKSMTEALGGQLIHVKAHGALYNHAAKDEGAAEAIASAIYAISPNLILYAPVNSLQAEIAKRIGLHVKMEAFLDRRYNQNLSLVSRKKERAVIFDSQEALQQIMGISNENQITTIDGQKLPMQADTFCIHGDNPQALAILTAIKAAQI